MLFRINSIEIKVSRTPSSWLLYAEYANRIRFTKREKAERELSFLNASHAAPVRLDPHADDVTHGVCRSGLSSLSSLFSLSTVYLVVYLGLSGSIWVYLASIWILCLTQARPEPLSDLFFVIKYPKQGHFRNSCNQNLLLFELFRPVPSDLSSRKIWNR